MNVSYSWLKKYVDFDQTPSEVAEILTSIGLEVAAVEEHESIRGGLEGLVIGKVLTCVEHSNSDHLHVTTVDLGSKFSPDGPVQIVCGAPNIAAGQTVVVATIGTTLYSGEESFVIKKGKIRGEESFGMICSEVEIGVGTDASGIMVLPSDIPAGTLAKDYFEVISDHIIEVEITPNRVDGTSHYGVARDLYAYLKTHGYETALRKPELPEVKAIEEEPVTLSLLAPEACRRYSGIVIKDMTVGDSPKWLRNALEIIGQKSINNVVDVANYVLFELGQPLHTFDLDKITGDEIQVRLAKDGETLTTLDGNEIKLMERDLVIADAEKPMCLAGVMGGLDSGVTKDTKNMFLEIATFDPTFIRKSARRYGFNTDASFRFERGLDPEQIPDAMRRAISLILEVTGGHIASRVYDEYPEVLERYKVDLTIQKVQSLTGLPISEEKIIEILETLDIKVKENNNGALKLEVPRYRFDVTRDIDVIEDILRIYGYNEYPESKRLTSTISVNTPTDISIQMQQKVSEQLVGAGFNEILNNSLSKAVYYLDENEKGKAVQVMNPLSSDLSTMRMTLIHGGLETINFNLNRQAHNLRLFEFGNCYRRAEEGEPSPLAGFVENFRLGLWMTGDAAPMHWARKEYEAISYELKAVLMNVLTRLGLNQSELLIEKSGDSAVYEAAEIITLRGGDAIAKWGLVSRELLKKHDISTPVYFAEIEWNPIMDRVLNREVKFTPIPKFFAVKRDFALLVDKHVTFAAIEQVARKAGGKLLKSIVLFDVYEDSNHLPEGKKSYAVNFELQDPEKTLSDKVIDKTMNKIYDALNKSLGAELR